MGEFTDDELFLHAVDAIVLDVLERFGGYSNARFAFFGRLLDVAREVGCRPVLRPELDR